MPESYAVPAALAFACLLSLATFASAVFTALLCKKHRASKKLFFWPNAPLSIEYVADHESPRKHRTRG